ncbi:Cathepsin O [Liparis tanakae]|uniref:Cathepsin O n=1 Tax=Liparis tanakae TaxID=230148 RepID=A0A4Z2HYS9_9TELE|nr:Cathepsin O [Liparis tanakae]
MGGGHPYLAVLAAVSTLLCPPRGLNGSSEEETRTTQFNGSAAVFRSFRANFRRVFAADGEEFDRRHLHFQDATKRHAYLNSFSTVPQSAEYGVNQFSDLSQDEFRELYLGASAGCGSCWAFSVVGALQSVRAIGGGRLQQLSVQQVLDCSFRNNGCSGGSAFQALSWLKQTRVKLVPESEYPYKAKTGMCHFFPRSHDGVSVRNFTSHDFSGQEEAMMSHLVERGPLAVIVDAVSWQDYLGGIIQHHCSSKWANHAVLVVGYNAVGDIPYWIVQNSWGASWGNEGYVYIKIGGNLCGIADSVAAVFL